MHSLRMDKISAIVISMNPFLQILLFLATTHVIKAYDLQIANISVRLSAQAYCDIDNYNTMSFPSPAQGFQIDTVLHDTKSDMQGYVGHLPSAQTTYVVFRGSSSVRNWIDDFEVLKTAYTSFAECVDCNVHKGFYAMTLALKSAVIQSIQHIGYSRVIVTGHSEGAAVAQLICMELYANDIDCDLYNFGQPRIGDPKYAIFVNRVIKNLFRFTHTKDIVPHVPPPEMNYQHSCQEIYENEQHQLTPCSSCEDPNGADQYSLRETTTADHLFYLNYNITECTGK